MYQILRPGAHELCVYFGMLSRDSSGDLAASFMLPGFPDVLSPLLYVRTASNDVLCRMFAAVQAASPPSLSLRPIA